jgi:hypothetical protein
MMFGIFKSKPLLEPDFVDWQFQCFEWLLRNTGGMKAWQEGTKLIKPTEEFFPNGGNTQSELAESIFRQVKQHSGMSDWPCRLQVQEADSSFIVAPMVVLQGAPSSPLGTFTCDSEKEEVIITYNPDSVSNPMSLIATFAHELAHYLTATFEEEPPGGWENWEYATDVAATFLGFGIFSANSHFNYSQLNSDNGEGGSGWQTSRQGYLSEPELLNAHAIFSCLMDLPVTESIPHLKSSLRGSFKQAYKDVTSFPGRIESLKAI